MIFENFCSIILLSDNKLSSDNSTRIKRVLPFQNVMMGGWVSASSYVCKVTAAASAVTVDPLVSFWTFKLQMYLHWQC